MMDDKMKAAFDAWIKEQPSWSPEHGWSSRSFDRVIEWTLDYLRSQQEPEVWSSESWIKEATDGKSGYIVGEARAGFTVPLYAAPVAAQPEQITPKQLARLIADNPDVQFSVKPRPADEELRRDAERYRWLAGKARVEQRDGGYHALYFFPCVDRSSASRYNGATPFFYATPGEAIDAAIAAEKREGEG